MSTSNGLPANLSKLTVPRLKALCKERRITGYSKLSKAALLQKLTEVSVPSNATTPSIPNDQASQNATATPSPTSVAAVGDPTNVAARIESSTTGREGNAANVAQQPVQPVTTSNTESTGATSAKDPPTEPPESSNRTVTSTTSTLKTSGTKRPAHIAISVPVKRVRTSLKLTTTEQDPPVLRIPILQQKPSVDPSTFKVPELPAQYQRVSTLAKQPSKPSAPCQIAGGPGRFKPLVVIPRPKPVAPVPTIDSPHASRFQASSPPVLSHISLPPKASERKWVYQWAIILSALSPADRRTCALVSRTFRYAVYLSAVHILSRIYPGRRLDVVLRQYPKNMTNFWPYLRYRMAEVFERRQVFERSFFGRYTRSIGYDPLSRHLWTCPDDEKQVDIAIRFVLTRMWFAVSVGAYGHDASTWSRCVVQDAREVTKGEVWQIIARDVGTGESCDFYVLEATCEVIGQPPSSKGEKVLGYCLRADWSAWISQRTRAPLDTGPCSLLDRVKWSNTEDYHRGISKAWLRRVQDQDTENIAKRIVAERYILASVMANGISGQWMSTSAMAQEFAGLPCKDALNSKTQGRPTNIVNMYLPAHHHVESIHFTTSRGEALHNAVAVVQTPGREYYILQDNGMQVGCEEEGIPTVWQQILSCDTSGIVQ